MPNPSQLASLKEHFKTIDAPRAAHRIQHQLLDMVMIVICAIICGAYKYLGANKLKKLR
jgi:hypothetical protein